MPLSAMGAKSWSLFLRHFGKIPEFAADFTAVHIAKATQEYQDAQPFFERTLAF